MSAELPERAQRVQQALLQFGAPFSVVQYPAGTRSAEDAAKAIGGRVGQIAKSLVFRGAESSKPILVIASGANRVNEQRLADRVGERIVKADAEFVRRSTGFAIGGVPPIGFASAIETWIDADLLRHTEIWAAAGTPDTVFSLTPDALVTLTGGTVTQIT